MGYPCTNGDGCDFEMQDRGNYYYCLACGNLVFKLPDINRPWAPLPRQKSFLYATQKYGLYVGGVGSGKTMSGAYKAILKSLDHPGGQGLIGAQIFPQLRDATMHTFWQVCPEKLMWKGSKKEAFNKTDGILTMANEFQILFRPLYDPEVLKSLNLVFFWIDEASDVQPDIFLQLQSRLRSMKGYEWYEDEDNNKPAHQGWVTSNPNGHDWLWEMFVQQEDADYFWINAPTKENKYLPKDFEASLRRRWPEAWVKRFLDGSFDVFEGQIYPMLDKEVHAKVPTEYFEDHIHQVPPGWPVIVSLDHGFTNPTSVGFYTVTPDERVIRFDEHYENMKPTSYHARKVKEILASWGVKVENVQDWLIDPSTKGQKGMEGKDVMSEYLDKGLPFRPANNKVQAGILQVIEYLSTDPIFNQPFFYIHRRCVNAWREMQAYRWKPRPANSVSNEPEEPVKKNDHAPDDIRYMIQSRPRIDLLKTVNPFQLFKEAQLGRQFKLDEKNLPYALRSHSNFNSTQASGLWKW